MIPKQEIERTPDFKAKQANITKLLKKKKKDIEKNKNRHRLGWGAENGGVKGIKEILTAK